MARNSQQICHDLGKLHLRMLSVKTAKVQQEIKDRIDYECGELQFQLAKEEWEREQKAGE